MPPDLIEAYQLMHELQTRLAVSRLAGFSGPELEMYQEAANEGAMLFGLAFHRHAIQRGVSPF